MLELIKTQMKIPLNNKLSIGELTQVFNNTAASYKYYWFLSLLQLFIKNKENSEIEVRDVLIQMICNAWYPVNYFKLSFGYSDQLQKNITLIQKKLNVPIDISLDDLFCLLRSNKDKSINKLVTHFSLQVPYRFLSPWIKFESNSKTIEKSKQFQNNCIYSISNDESFQVQINPLWKDYLLTNYKILQDFTYWRLAIYVQELNLNIPNVPQKLIKPNERSGLNKQRKFWGIVFDELNTIDCIYTGKSLVRNDFHMEHFVPWSFVLHNKLWNLLPSDSSINSSKGSKLPNLNNYIKPYVEIQREALRIVHKTEPTHKLLEDYLFLGGSISEILDMSDKKLQNSFKNTLEPLIQIASNSGFERWRRDSTRDHT